MRQEERWGDEGFEEAEEGAPGGGDGGEFLHDGLVDIRIRCGVRGRVGAGSYENGPNPKSETGS